MTICVHIVCVCVWRYFSCVWLFATPWTVACQAPLSLGFSRQEYWSRLPCPPFKGSSWHITHWNHETHSWWSTFPHTHTHTHTHTQISRGKVKVFQPQEKHSSVPLCLVLSSQYESSACLDGRKEMSETQKVEELGCRGQHHSYKLFGTGCHDWVDYLAAGKL